MPVRHKAWLKGKHRYHQAAKPIIAERREGVSTLTWGRVWADLMALEVGRSFCCRTDCATAEITKEDKERRQQEINAKAERMVRSGLAVKTAKTKAAKEWNEENPWYTKGNTQGKV